MKTSLDPLLKKLEVEHGAAPEPPTRDPFELVLWENVGYLVDDAKRRAAFEALRERVGLDAERIADADLPSLCEVTRLGGSHAELRATRLKAIAEVALELGDLTEVAQRPLKEALKAFQRFPSIGGPGAEKILMTSGHHAVLALESNGLRVLLRLGFGEESKNYATSYRAARTALGPLPAEPAWHVRAHALLRRHGQEVCKTTRPACESCILRPDCLYWRNHAETRRGQAAR